MHRASSFFYLSALVILFSSTQSTDGLRILAVFPVAGKSHFFMSESLARALAERGHQVDVYSHFPLKKALANYKDHSLVGSMPILSNNISCAFLKQVVGQHISIARMLAVGGNPPCEILNLPIVQRLIKDPPTDPPYDLVITELFISNCFLAFGRHLNVPLVGLATTNLFDWLHEPLGNPHNLAVDSSVFSEYSAPMTFYERLQNFLMSHYIKHAFNYYAREQDALVEKYFGAGFPDVVQLQKDIDLVLVNYHQALSGIKVHAPAIVPVGGLHIVDNNETLPHEVQRFLDESRHGFVYVSFGSMVRLETFPESVLAAFYGAFKSIAPVRVLLKIAKAEELPAGLPSNVLAQSWLAQIAVLKHANIRAFVTHGGLMGTQESIYFGVPMVGIPLFGDQHFNIKSYVRKNLAVKLDWQTMSEQSLTEAIKTVIDNPVYKKSADEVGQTFRDVPMSPRDTAVYWVEYIARHGKNALRSPLVDMPWWQASLLDVYAFLILLLLLVIHIVKRFAAMAIRIVWPSREQDSKLKRN